MNNFQIKCYGFQLPHKIKEYAELIEEKETTDYLEKELESKEDIIQEVIFNKK